MKTTTRTSLTRFALLTTMLMLAGLTCARAAIVVVAPTLSTTGSFTITQDITFTISTGVAGGTSLYFMLDEWVISDGSQNEVGYNPSLSIAINGGAAQTFGNGFFGDNRPNTVGAFTPNDGYFYLTMGPALTTNDTVTVKAGSYTLGMNGGFNQQGTQTFTGNMFMVTVDGTQISNTVVVPEPSTCAMTSLGILALVGCQRLRRRSADKSRKPSHS